MNKYNFDPRTLEIRSLFLYLFQFQLFLFVRFAYAYSINKNSKLNTYKFIDIFEDEAFTNEID